eukprot:11224986-Lingulodinium_polyedra.AAC.1
MACSGSRATAGLTWPKLRNGIWSSRGRTLSTTGRWPRKYCRKPAQPHATTWSWKGFRGRLTLG